jgi:hypothetical protein
MSTLKRYDLLMSWHQSGARCQHILHGVPASQHNNMLIDTTLAAWSMIIDDLLTQEGFSEQQRNAKLRAWRSTCYSADFAYVIVTCKQAYNLLIDLLSKQVVGVCYSDFKDQISCVDLSAALIGDLFAPISSHLKKCLSATTNVVNGVYVSDVGRSLEVCSFFLSFPLKVNFTDVGLEEKALHDYLDMEEFNRSFQMPDTRTIAGLRTIITNWFKDYRYDTSLVKHGSGAVADSVNTKAAKYHSFQTDQMLDYLINQELARNEEPEIVGMVKELLTVPHLDRTSKLVFVPKDVTKLRSISMEPASLQYFQQAAFRSIAHYMDHHEIGRHISLSDQGQNKALAYDGSCTNKYATLDLSSASDTVNWILVKDLFKGCPHLLRVLYATRSTHTALPDGNVCELLKFAPMGSALCFPIESIIFAAIAKLAVQVADEKGLLTNPQDGSHTTFFSVFGDDTIVPSAAAEICATLLNDCGFILNKNKSYLTGPFKESCGGNYFCGHDITGLKFKPDFDETYKNNVSPESNMALVMYANMAYSRGFKIFRCYCIHMLLDAGIKPLFGSDIENSSMIFSSHPTNFHLKKRVNTAYQVNEVKMTRAIPIQKETSEWESQMYLEWCIYAHYKPQGLWKRNKYGEYILNCGFAISHNTQASRKLRLKECWVTDVTTVFALP